MDAEYQRSAASKDMTSEAYLIRIFGRQGFIVRVRVPSSMLHGLGGRGVDGFGRLWDY